MKGVFYFDRIWLLRWYRRTTLFTSWIKKIADYESAQIFLLWVFNPDLKTVRVIRPNQPTINLRRDELLSGEEIIPGFSVKIKDLFPPAPGKIA